MSQELIRKTDIKIKLSKLQYDMKWILKYYHMKHNQMGFTHRPSALMPAWDSVGSLWNDGVKFAQERDFTEFVESFKDTYFYDLYKTFPFNIGRMRIMKLEPGRCLSFHTDDEIRWHIALETNDRTFFYFEGGKSYQIPVDGYVYEMDGTVRHTVFNGHRTESRYHLMMTDAN